MLLVIVSMTALGIYLTSSVTTSELSDLRSELENEAMLTAEASISSFGNRNEISDLDILAKKLGNQIDARVTFIAEDGTVLGDSQENPLAMENHAGRPEVRDALGIGKRYVTPLMGPPEADIKPSDNNATAKGEAVKE